MQGAQQIRDLDIHFDSNRCCQSRSLNTQAEEPGYLVPHDSRLTTRAYAFRLTTPVRTLRIVVERQWNAASIYYTYASNLKEAVNLDAVQTLVDINGNIPLSRLPLLSSNTSSKVLARSLIAQELYRSTMRQTLLP